MSAESIRFNYVFLSTEIDENFNWEKSQFCQLIPTKPFTIAFDIVKRLNDGESDEAESIEYWTEEDIEEARRREEEEEEEKQNKQINRNKIFKSNECVICLTTHPMFCFVIADI